MRKLLSLLLVLLLPLFADVDAQIEAIQKANASERFQLMNAFKQEIVKMQERERLEAVNKLRSITKSKNADKTFNKLHMQIEAKCAQEAKGQKKEHPAKRAHDSHTQEHIESETDDSIENEIEDQIENETQDHEEDAHDND